MAFASSTDHSVRSSLLASFMTWLENTMEASYKASAIARDFEELNGISDADLEAQGRTRAEAMRSLAVRYGYI